jgi:hypothetical protein
MRACCSIGTTPSPERLDEQVVHLVGVGAAADHAHRRQRVQRPAVGIALDEVPIAGVLHQPGDPGDRPVPRLLFPLARSRGAVLDGGEPAIVDDVLFEGDALGTERPLVDRMVWIALDVHHRGHDVA